MTSKVFTQGQLVRMKDATLIAKAREANIEFEGMESDEIVDRDALINELVAYYDGLKPAKVVKAKKEFSEVTPGNMKSMRAAMRRYIAKAQDAAGETIKAKFNGADDVVVNVSFTANEAQEVTILVNEAQQDDQYAAYKAIKALIFANEAEEETES